MSLHAGDKLGPNEMLAPIGTGGMGEVWKASDSRLDRIVAIKAFNEKFSERFEREARAVAALNHPNIYTLHDVGPNYLVMENIEGTQPRGPLPLENAIEYSGQILDSLDAAYRKGITHRDLKPTNILVTKQGIKLLDFGLAKQTVRLGEDEPTKALTDQGQIIGTLQYMSPEQLQGKEGPYEIVAPLGAGGRGCPHFLERRPVPIDVWTRIDQHRRLRTPPHSRSQTRSGRPHKS